MEGVEAGRNNLLPGIGIALIALSIVLAYQFWEPATRAFDAISGFRERTGWIFGILSTALFGGLIPILVRQWVLKMRSAPSDYAFGIGFWAYKGFEVALLYEFQAQLWGEETTFEVIAAKVAVDQGLYNPLLAVPTMVIAYLWHDCGYSWSATRKRLRVHGYWERALPILISNTAVWLPAATIIYLLPTSLQLPLQNLVLVGWVLLLLLLTKKRQASGSMETDQKGNPIER